MRNPRSLVAGSIVAAVTLVLAAVAVAAGGGWLSQNSPGVRGAAQDGDFFAAAVATGDVNGDGYDDVISGVPYENVGSAADAGRVHVVLGSGDGLSDAGDRSLHADSPGVAGESAAGDLLGYALAVGDFDGDGYDDAALGAPGADVRTRVDAGRVVVLYGAGGGLSGARSQALSQRSPGIRGAAEAHDEFGLSLAAGDFDGDGHDDLAVGIPGETIGGSAGAGAVQVLFGSETGVTAAGDQILSQDAGSVPGTAETEDRFGWALAAGDFDRDGYEDLAVGAPGQRLGQKKPAAGIVQWFTGGPEGIDLASGRGLSQNATWVQGAAGKDDGFGAALAVGDADGDGYDDLAVGAPGEAFESQPAAGSAHLLYGSARGVRAAGSRTLAQATPGVRGTPEAGDEFGLAVALVDLDGDGRDDLLVAAPGERVGGVVAAGAVHAFYSRSTGLAVGGDELWRAGYSGITGQPEPHGGFGRAVVGGDLDGDGLEELVVGAPGASAGSRQSSGAFAVIAR